ncbi:hypothetical protein JYT72_00635 [Crocinitomix catalasitica]|nr:hypothetical protein [Crocinitomix catalasitica]
MKNLLIALSLILYAQTAHTGIFDLDTNRERPRLLIKSSVSALLNWRTSLSYIDIGVEFGFAKRFSLDADVGKYYRSMLSSNSEYTTGFFTDAALRYYPDIEMSWASYYFALQYRYQRKQSQQEIDFNDAGLPYSKLIDIERNSNMILLMFGSNRMYFFERLYFDWNLGFGLEYRLSKMKGLVDFELEAIETGDVDGIKYDDAEGRFNPAVHFEVKIGFRIF